MRGRLARKLFKMRAGCPRTQAMLRRFCNYHIFYNLHAKLNNIHSKLNAEGRFCNFYGARPLKIASCVPLLTTMKKLEIHRRSENHCRKRITPLSRIQTQDVVKTVLKNLRRLEELLDMLGDKDISVRGRAVATLAQLAESRPESLLKTLPRLREYMDDDSDYVRWHLVYVLGEISARLSEPTQECLADIFTRMDDDSRIVRMFAGKAALRLAAKHPDAVAAFFKDIQRPVPPKLAKFLNEGSVG